MPITLVKILSTVRSKTKNGHTDLSALSNSLLHKRKTMNLWHHSLENFTVLVSKIQKHILWKPKKVPLSLIFALACSFP